MEIEFQIVAISVGVVSVAVGIGVPIFYETQIDNAVSLPFSFSNSDICNLFPTIKLRNFCVAGEAREHSTLLPLRWIGRT